LFTVARQGWLWLVNPANSRTDLLAADGLIGCSGEFADTYRARRSIASVSNFNPLPSNKGRLLRCRFSIKHVKVGEQTLGPEKKVGRHDQVS
jgi:hypothetical protein